MADIEKLAFAVLSFDSLEARALIPAFYEEDLILADIAKPKTEDNDLLAASAALIELIAMRRKQKPPAWTSEVGALKHSRYLLKSAATMGRLRTLCEIEGPEPLRRRGLFAPPSFLEYV